MKKNKEHAPSSIRTYDKDGFRRRAACVCVKDDSESEVLLVSRPRQINQWIFPGGGIEPREDPRHAASREVVEEAGVIGSIIRCLGVFETEQTRTCVYVLRVSNEFSEWDDSINCGRTRMWFNIYDAASVLGSGHSQLAYLYGLKNGRENLATPTAPASSSASSDWSSSWPRPSASTNHVGCCCPLNDVELAKCQNGSSPPMPRTNGTSVNAEMSQNLNSRQKSKFGANSNLNSGNDAAQDEGSFDNDDGELEEGATEEARQPVNR